MKAKTSITLSTELLSRIDRVTGNRSSRSAFIEGVLRNHFDQSARRRLHARDLARINASVERLNQEALEVLEDQTLE